MLTAWRRLVTSRELDPVKVKYLGACLYVLVVLPISAWFAGAAVRDEQSAWVVPQVQDEYRRSGIGGAILVLALYSIFYLGLYLTPYMLLASPLANPPTEADRKERLVLRHVTSFWVLFSFLLFAKPLGALIEVYPTGPVWEWIGIAWILGTLFMLWVWTMFLREQR